MMALTGRFYHFITLWHSIFRERIIRKGVGPAVRFWYQSLVLFGDAFCISLISGSKCKGFGEFPHFSDVHSSFSTCTCKIFMSEFPLLEASSIAVDSGVIKPKVPSPAPSFIYRSPPRTIKSGSRHRHHPYFRPESRPNTNSTRARDSSSVRLSFCNINMISYYFAWGSSKSHLLLA